MRLRALGIIQSEKLREWLGRKGGESTMSKPSLGLAKGRKERKRVTETGREGTQKGPPGREGG